MLSFYEWERSLECASLQYQELKNVDDGAAAQVAKVEREESILEQITEKNETINKIHKLCRICTSNGLISIKSPITKSMLKVKPSGDKNNWEVPISKIIAEISGEKVSHDDSLPQFVCEHCLGYLQHAWELRQKIISNTKNLRIAKQIANEDSVYLETSIDQSRVTKREVDEWDEETNEASHFLKQFSGADITISQNSTRNNRESRLLEHKCPSCQKRVMSIKSLNDHMKLCSISVLDALFSQLKYIYSMRLQTRFTTKEYILHAIKLVFDAQKKLQIIVNANNIDVSSITSEIPTEVNGSMFPQPHKNHFKRRDHQSPDDIGYISGGGNCTYALR